MHFVPEPAIDLQHAPAIVADDSGGDSEYYYNSRQAEACLPLQEIQNARICLYSSVICCIVSQKALLNHITLKDVKESYMAIF